MAFIIEIDTGELVTALEIRAEQEGVALISESSTTVVHRDRVINITKAATPSIKLTGTEQNKIALMMLKVEQCHRQFQALYPLGAISSFEVAVYGSSSLTLNILPGRLSHDVDIATGKEFVDFLEENNLLKNERGLELSPNYSTIMRYAGRWERRCTQVLGTADMVFNVLHPIDTLSMKLMRIDVNTFQQKDEGDIKAIISTFNVTRSDITSLLQESFERFIAPEPIQIQANRRNTEWLYRELFNSKVDIEAELIHPAQRDYQKATASKFIPLREEQKWNQLIQ
jgi:hypothetical protein